MTASSTLHSHLSCMLEVHDQSKRSLDANIFTPQLFSEREQFSTPTHLPVCDPPQRSPLSTEFRGHRTI